LLLTSVMGFPNQFFNESWVVGIWRAGHGGNNVELGRLGRWLEPLPVLDASLSDMARCHLIVVYPYRVEAGGLASYGPDLADLYRRAAGYVDRILK
jgi:hypothetical protein